MILDFWWQLLLGGIAVYLFCNVNYAVLISKFKMKKDIRTCGSGNPGTTNMLRTFGFKFGVMTFLLDTLKGVVAALAGILIFKYAVGAESAVIAFAGYFFAMCAVLGHIYPVFLKFKGGKGFATTIGAFLVLQPMWTAIFIVIGLILLIAWDYMSVFALFFATALFVQNTVRFFTEPFIAECGYIWLFIVVMAIVWFAVIIAHRSNIKRLLTGCENKTGIRKAFSKKKKASSENNNDEKI